MEKNLDVDQLARHDLFIAGHTKKDGTIVGEEVRRVRDQCVSLSCGFAMYLLLK